MKSLHNTSGKPNFFTEFFYIFIGLRNKRFLCHFIDNEMFIKALLWLYNKINRGNFSKSEMLVLIDVMKRSERKDSNSTLILFNDIRGQLAELK